MNDRGNDDIQSLRIDDIYALSVICQVAFLYYEFKNKSKSKDLLFLCFVLREGCGSFLCGILLIGFLRPF